MLKACIAAELWHFDPATLAVGHRLPCAELIAGRRILREYSSVPLEIGGEQPQGPARVLERDQRKL